MTRRTMLAAPFLFVVASRCACAATDTGLDRDAPDERAEAGEVGAPMQVQAPLTAVAADAPVDWMFALGPVVPDGPAGERADLHANTDTSIFPSPPLVDPTSGDTVRTLAVVLDTLRSVAQRNSSALYRTVRADSVESVEVTSQGLQRTRPAAWSGSGAVIPEDDPHADDPVFDLAPTLAPADGLTWGQVRDPRKLELALSARVR